MTTLLSHWTVQVSQFDQSLHDARVAQTQARLVLAQTQEDGRAAAQAVRTATDALEAARRALSGIAAPADGDPLLQAMTAATVAVSDARRRQAQVEQDLPRARADLAWCEAQQAQAQAQLQAARTALQREQVRRAERLAAAEALTTGVWSQLVADATQARAAHEAQARARVEVDVPTSATPGQSLLAAIRARKALVHTRAALTATVEGQVAAASLGATAQAQRAFDEAWTAVRQVLEAAPRLAEAQSTLQQLAALPAPSAERRPIVTLAQREALFRADLQATREAALTRLVAADTAEAALNTAWATWRQALSAGVQAHPGLSEPDLIAGPLAADFAAYDTAVQARDSARAALVQESADLALLDAWFAAVPEALWTALEQLDAAVQCLIDLQAPEIPAGLLATLDAREADLANALQAEALTERRARMASRAAALALHERQAAEAAAGRRARAMSRGTGPF